MSRIRRLPPAELDEEQQRLYAAIASGSRATGPQLFRLTDDEGGLEGPFNAMLLNPAIGDALQRLGAAIRYRGALSDRAREIAILAVAAHWNCGFEQRAHEAVAAHAGLSRDVIEAIREGSAVRLDDPREAAVLSTTRRLLDDADLDEDAYAAAVGPLGASGLFELTTLVGYYSMLALQMRIFRVG